MPRVNIECLTDGAEILYSLDGSEPSIVYGGGGIELAEVGNYTVTAKALKTGYLDSESVSQTVTIEQVSTPDISYSMADSSADFSSTTGTLNVSITCSTTGATIYAVVSNSLSQEYSGTSISISLTESSTVSAYAVCSGMVQSETITQEFTKPASPTYNVTQMNTIDNMEIYQISLTSTQPYDYIEYYDPYDGTISTGTDIFYEYYNPVTGITKSDYLLARSVYNNFPSDVTTVDIDPSGVGMSFGGTES